MSYDHDTEADFAASELARMFVASPELCHADGATPRSLSASATYEPSSSPWPLADGVIALRASGASTDDLVALEYKRPQEGLHGLLTALGQAHAYIHKGYNGAAIVVPSTYSSHSAPGDFLTGVIDEVTKTQQVGVFAYENPDKSSATPFAGRLNCVRPLTLAPATSPSSALTGQSRTQWVHMREGSTTRDAYFRFLQTAANVASDATPSLPALHPDLERAVDRLSPGADPCDYLAYVSDSSLLSRIWKAFWFDWVATPDVLTPWVNGPDGYSVPGSYTRIERDDGRGLSRIFEGRADGLKENIVQLLNDNVIDEAKAWEYFAGGIPRAGRQNKQGVRARAHSFREDLDSSLAHLAWIDADGRPTDFGYRFTSICERYGGPASSAAKEYVGATILKTGRYASLLHYIHRLSERIFSENPLAFARLDAKGNPAFTEESYTDYLSVILDAMIDELRVVRTAPGRARPRVRTVFQAELTLLRRYGFVSPTRHRLGVGIPIEWERVIEGLDVEL